MTDRLDKIRERLEAATPGPWVRTVNTAETQYLVRSKARTLLAEISWGGPMPLKAQSKGNAVLIAHAPEDIAYLLAEVDRLRTSIESRDRAAKAIMLGESQEVQLVTRPRPPEGTN